MSPTFQGEVMLLGWSESHNGGAKVTFQLADPSDLEPFKAMTVAKGKTAGQRLACVLVEIGEDEQPIARGHKTGQNEAENASNPSNGGVLSVDTQADKKPQGGPLAKLAGMWCNDPRFWEWIRKSQGWIVDRPESAASWVRVRCMIDSRAELDTDQEAAEIFHCEIREPFSAYLKAMEQGRVAA